MARGLTHWVVFHRETIDVLVLAAVDGLFDLSKEIIEDAGARAPDSPYDPYPAGEGLPKQGGVLAYAKGAKVNGWSQRGTQPSKPRAVREPSRESGFVIVAGFGFPAHFAELGTVNEPARPFVTPALMARVPDAEGYIRASTQRRLSTIGERSAAGAAIRARARG